MAKVNNWRLTPSATIGLIVAMFLTFVLAWIPSMSHGVVTWMGCDGSLAKPWTFLTYPFAWNGEGSGIIFLAFEWFWFYWIGTSLESSDGWNGLLLAFFGYTLLAGLLTALCGHLLGWHGILLGAWLPVSALTCVWAGRNPKMEIRLMMFIPVSGKILAILTAAANLFIYGTGFPLVGALAALPCVVGWLHGSGVLLGRRKTTVVSGRGNRAQSPQEFERFISQVRLKEKEREERDRLRRILEDGPSDSPDGQND